MGPLSFEASSEFFHKELPRVLMNGVTDQHGLA
jgi:hypothetical protein